MTDPVISSKADANVQARDANPLPRCDHICLLIEGHVEKGTLHQYGYELPSPRRAARLEEFIGHYAAYLDADSARRGGTGVMAERRQAQIIVLAEVLRFLNGDKRAFDSISLRDMVPLTPDEIEDIALNKTPWADEK